MSFGRLRREDQRFFLNGQEVRGIQAIREGYGVNRVPLKHLGMVGVSGMPRGPQVGEISINSLVLGDDPWINFTGASGFNGYIVRSTSNTGENFSFTSGYLTSYSFRAGIGQIPQISIGITVFGNMGRFNEGESTTVSGHLSGVASGNFSIPVLRVAGPNTMELDLLEADSNRMTSCALDINVPRNAVYALGSRTPFEVATTFPIEIAIRAEIEPDPYIPRKMKNYPNVTSSDDVIQDVTLTVKDYEKADQIIFQRTFPGMQLEEENWSADADSNATVSLVFRKYQMG